jgi:hypothetical protein
MKKSKYSDVPDGVIAHPTRECCGNLHDRRVVEVTSSGTTNNKDLDYAADLETCSVFSSAFRAGSVGIPHTRYNWLLYDFKEKRIVPTHYIIRTNCHGSHLRSWLVETSSDGKTWREVVHEENNKPVNGSYFAGAFEVAGGEECRFIRLVNIGRNHFGND